MTIRVDFLYATLAVLGLYKTIVHWGDESAWPWGVLFIASVTSFAIIRAVSKIMRGLLKEIERLKKQDLSK
jgi:hypothetical protein